MILTIKVGTEERKAVLEGPVLLSSALAQAGYPMDLPCAGRGRCGKCKVYAQGCLSPLSAEEEKLLTEDEIRNHCRLACQTMLTGDAAVTLIQRSEMAEIQTEAVSRNYQRDQADGYSVAVDIGTTTVAAVAVDLSSGRELASACAQNPQEKYGADVISRMERSLAGDRQALADCIQNCVNSLLEELSEKSGVSGTDFQRIVITGNTTMLFLLTNQDVDCLSHAPFEATDLFGREAPELSFPAAPGASCYLTRCNSAFVGGDITTAVLASGIAEDNRTSLLIDVGTNGEIVLAHQGKLSCSSTAAGPALEGAGIYMGMPAMGGAISRVFLQDGKIETETVGNLPDTGICGSGVIDAMAVLLKTGAVEETGLLLEEDHDFMDRICEAGTALAFRIGEKTLFTQKDIRAVQLAKAAICAGIRTLLHEAGLKPSDVERFVIAGGFGSHIQVDNAAAIGLFPPELAGKAEVLGNAALEGAAMLLQNRSFYESSYELAAQMETVDLSSNPYFSDQYMDSMIFEV